MRTMLLLLILMCSALMVPLTALAVQSSMQTLDVPWFKLNPSSNPNGSFGELVVLRQEEPGSGGGGTGLI